MSNARGNCQSLSLTESDRLFFGSGKNQIGEAMVICADCPIMDVCANQAKIRTSVQMANGVWTSEPAHTYGVFAGTHYRDGKPTGR